MRCTLSDVACENRQPEQMATSLDEVPADVFDRVWKIVTELGAYERHFNDIESRYRTLASTWLLAAFAAMGFVLSSTGPLPADPLLMVAALSIAGAAGVTLLWNLDLRVYHGLLDSAFRVGLELELAYRWLPPLRRRMSRGPHEAGTYRSSVVYRVVWYYLGGNAALLIAGGVALALWAHSHGTPALVLAGTGAAATLLSLNLWIYRSSTRLWADTPRGYGVP